MAEIVYEGGAGSGGNLFAGIKFFFLQRVPFRDKYVQDVTVTCTAFYCLNHADLCALE